MKSLAGDSPRCPTPRQLGHAATPSWAPAGFVFLPQRICLEPRQIKEASGLTWADLARELGTTTLNVWRWRKGVRPNAHHLLALQDLARRMDLEHLLPRAYVQRRPHR